MHGRKISGAIVTLWGGEAEEGKLGVPVICCVRMYEAQPTRSETLDEQLLHAALEERWLARSEERQSSFVDLDGVDLVAQMGEADGRGQTDVARADNTDRGTRSSSPSTCGSCQYLLGEVLKLGGKACFVKAPGVRGDVCAVKISSQDLAYPGRDVLWLGAIKEHSGLSFENGLEEASGAQHRHRTSEGHRLEGSEPEVLGAGRQERGSIGVQPSQLSVGDLLEKEAVRRGIPTQCPFLRTAPDDHEPQIGQLRHRRGKDIDAFVRDEPGDREEVTRFKSWCRLSLAVRISTMWRVEHLRLDAPMSRHTVADRL